MYKEEKSESIGGKNTITRGSASRQEGLLEGVQADMGISLGEGEKVDAEKVEGEKGKTSTENG